MADIWQNGRPTDLVDIFERLQTWVIERGLLLDNQGDDTRTFRRPSGSNSLCSLQFQPDTVKCVGHTFIHFHWYRPELRRMQMESEFDKLHLYAIMYLSNPCFTKGEKDVLFVSGLNAGDNKRPASENPGRFKSNMHRKYFTKPFTDLKQNEQGKDTGGQYRFNLVPRDKDILDRLMSDIDKLMWLRVWM